MSRLKGSFYIQLNGENKKCSSYLMYEKGHQFSIKPSVKIERKKKQFLIHMYVIYI
jgi:hypothetical protein